MLPSQPPSLELVDAAFPERPLHEDERFKALHAQWCALYKAALAESSGGIREALKAVQKDLLDGPAHVRDVHKEIVSHIPFDDDRKPRMALLSISSDVISRFVQDLATKESEIVLRQKKKSSLLKEFAAHYLKSDDEPAAQDADGGGAGNLRPGTGTGAENSYSDALAEGSKRKHEENQENQSETGDEKRQETHSNRRRIEENVMFCSKQITHSWQGYTIGLMQASFPDIDHTASASWLSSSEGGRQLEGSSASVVRVARPLLAEVLQKPGDVKALIEGLQARAPRDKLCEMDAAHLRRIRQCIAQD